MRDVEIALSNGVDGPEPKGTLIIIEFPNREQAEAFWDAPNYQEAAKLREVERRKLEAAERELRLVETFEQLKVEITKLHLFLYIGRMINPINCQLQVQGAAMMGVGQALFEELAWDDAFIAACEELGMAIAAGLELGIYGR